MGSRMRIGEGVHVSEQALPSRSIQVMVQSIRMTRVLVASWWREGLERRGHIPRHYPLWMNTAPGEAEASTETTVRQAVTFLRLDPHRQVRLSATAY